MKKVGEIIAPMKDNFIVAYLACASAKKENMVVPKEIKEYRERHGIRSLHEAGGEDSSKQEDAKKMNGASNMAIKNEPDDTNGNSAPNSNDAKDGGETNKINGGNGLQPNNIAVKVESDDQAATNGNSGENSGDAAKAEKPKTSSVVVAREGKFAAMEARKRSIEGKVKTEEKSGTSKKDKAKVSATITVKDSKGRIVKVLDDDAEEMDCEFLNTRQLFLELCQTNNYQYDQMRRAKHSSMMVLFHLHNRDAPKFVQQCAVCAREILSGYRFHCPTCADFDLCQDCFGKSERNIIQRHPHQLKRIPVTTDGKAQPTDEQRKERQRSIQLHMTLLLHAASCNSTSCTSQNCAKMKSLLKHGETCPTKHTGGCNVCKRIYTLLQIHARQCKDPKCPVPKCLAFRQRFRQLALQQRAMDDRRRQQMNIQYRTAHT